jgi:hypothetical protein
MTWLINDAYIISVDMVHVLGDRLQSAGASLDRPGAKRGVVEMLEGTWSNSDVAI